MIVIGGLKRLTIWFLVLNLSLVYLSFGGGVEKARAEAGWSYKDVNKNTLVYSSGTNIIEFGDLSSESGKLDERVGSKTYKNVFSYTQTNSGLHGNSAVPFVQRDGSGKDYVIGIGMVFSEEYMLYDYVYSFGKSSPEYVYYYKNNSDDGSQQALISVSKNVVTKKQPIEINTNSIEIKPETKNLCSKSYISQPAQSQSPNPIADATNKLLKDSNSDAIKIFKDEDLKNGLTSFVSAPRDKELYETFYRSKSSSLPDRSINNPEVIRAYQVISLKYSNSFATWADKTEIPEALKVSATIGAIFLAGVVTYELAGAPLLASKKGLKVATATGAASYLSWNFLGNSLADKYFLPSVQKDLAEQIYAFYYIGKQLEYHECVATNEPSLPPDHIYSKENLAKAEVTFDQGVLSDINNNVINANNAAGEKCFEADNPFSFFKKGLCAIMQMLIDVSSTLAVWASRIFSQAIDSISSESSSVTSGVTTTTAVSRSR